MEALTARELEVLAQLQQGHSDKVIAHNLGIAFNTQKKHLGRMMKKLGATNRIQVFLATMTCTPMQERETNGV